MKALLVTVLAVLGLLALAVGIVYFVVPAHSLPSFIPGRIAIGHPGARAHHSRRGTAAVVIGAVLLVLAVVAGLAVPSRATRRP